MHQLRIECHGRLVMELLPEQSGDEMLAAIRQQGEILKSSHKFLTRRVGSYAIKESRVQGGAGIVKRTLRRAHYRQAWAALLRLHQRGVGVPLPHGFIEERLAGLVIRNYVVTGYLDGLVNVEVFARTLAAIESENALPYLLRLAKAVNRLPEVGAYHGDLSGKNIFTQTGNEFYFIDLDEVRLDVEYTPERRLRNLVQLHDSFCDLWPDAIMRPFIEAMLPPGADCELWFARVKAGQAIRRAKVEAKWRRQGRRAI